MIELIESRIDELNTALDANFQWTPPSGLELLVELLAKKCEEEMPEEMRGAA